MMAKTDQAPEIMHENLSENYGSNGQKVFILLFPYYHRVNKSKS